jgi:hypothetical protein
MARRLVLLGDSIFDSGTYVQPGEPDVAAHLRARLPPADWQVGLRAISGLDWMITSSITFITFAFGMLLVAIQFTGGQPTPAATCQRRAPSSTRYSC